MATQTITYADKVALNENAGVAAINKCQAADMNEIKSVVNNNAAETGNNSTDIDNLQIYSTAETNTGKVWIDGKPIYRKCFNWTWPSNADNTHVSVSGLNIDKMLDMRGTLRYANGFHNIGAYANSNYYSLAQYNISETQVTIYGSSANYKGRDVILIIEYTKTTD